MPNRTCSVEGCDSSAVTRGWCQMHYMRWYRTGSLGEAHSSVEDVFLKRIFQKISMPDGPGGCWLWESNLIRGGYGQMRWGKPMSSHRLLYQLYIGPIPDGLALDHLCRVRRCCNPGHLEPVTHAENVRRGFEDRARERLTAQPTKAILVGSEAATDRGCGHSALS